MESKSISNENCRVTLVYSNFDKENIEALKFSCAHLVEGVYSEEEYRSLSGGGEIFSTE